MYTAALMRIGVNDYRKMARQMGHMLLMATEYMPDGNLANMMMNQLEPFTVAQYLDSARVPFFEAP